MRLAVVLTAFALVFPAELPDKTTLASIVLATRYRPLPVWLGAMAAFAVQCALAVTAGRLLALLPHRAVVAAAAVLFALGAVLALRSGAADEVVDELPPARSSPRIAATAFGVLLLAEFGDFTQLATASLASRYDAPFSVFLGAWLALVCVSGLAVVTGRGLLRVVPLRAVRIVAASLFAVVAVLSAVEAVRG
ncbi:MAG: Ca2+/H+ antiporter, family [Frankiaceae bacterium]|jgi:putative Ca2+/H+ antiporter (TMEM165/GDT1 family)|nr:Ca2+/H+ antiporter, family [Frankiaceae bacterium]